MAQSNVKSKFPSELRFDLVSQDWVVIATGRAKRPETFKKKTKEEEAPQESCPFCKIETQERATLIFSQGKEISFDKTGVVPKDWTTVAIPNKFPALIPGKKLNKKREGKFYQKMNAIGYHEVVVTKDHWRSLGQFTAQQVKEVIDVYHKRYITLMKMPFVGYISIFHNHGAGSGASIFHPHSQIITTPLIDTDLKKAILNSENYYKKTGQCIYCQMNRWEKRSKARVIFENNKFLAVCPFASKAAFEVIISPKFHSAQFEKITDEEKWQLAEAFQAALSKLYKGLLNPAYNFYLHTAPVVGGKYNHYHWHWTILPKTDIPAGFEIGTRMEISTIEPEKAAEYLRRQ